MASILELQDLYSESLTQELLQKTTAGTITWTNMGGNQFHAAASPWDYYISKTQLASLTYRYNLDVKQSGVTQLSLQDGPLPYTDRDSVTKELYDTVELIVLQLDAKVKSAVSFVQGLS